MSWKRTDVDLSYGGEGSTLASGRWSRTWHFLVKTSYNYKLYTFFTMERVCPQTLAKKEEYHGTVW
ncbi:hypothetical protein GCM10011409_01360 [Lentibacillus populi]|uniref:Uncharacterized protein n=1 Tax=Lentibacillus populi TaxID=1827502 RepID=A0A9W5TTN4_9BACI|nr:hypothetical protein GCM10011409_01360 [Lentibacillus populi]